MGYYLVSINRRTWHHLFLSKLVENVIPKQCTDRCNLGDERLNCRFPRGSGFWGADDSKKSARMCNFGDGRSSLRARGFVSKEQVTAPWRPNRHRALAVGVLG